MNDDSGVDRPHSFTERVDGWLFQLDGWRQQPILPVLAALAVAVLIAAGWWLGRTPERRPIDELIPQVRLETTESIPQTIAALVVHVAGAVAQPGVYTLEGDARVLDAIEAAGGAASDADLDQLNLAAPLVDGVQIRVPVHGEILTAAPLGTSESSGPLDVNRATVEQLDELPGVGPATAAAIVSWRDEHGPFDSVDALLAVPGIGPAKLDGFAEMVRVS